MGRLRKIVLAALPVLVLCVPGILPAQSTAADVRVFAYHLPEAANATAATVVLDASTGVIGWDISVTIDPVTCEVYCSYKQRRSPIEPAEFERLAPLPVVIVQVTLGWPALPVNLTIDPSGLGLPTATGDAALAAGNDFLPSRRLLLLLSLRTLVQGDAVAQPAPLLSMAGTPQAPPAAITPLRV